MSIRVQMFYPDGRPYIPGEPLTFLPIQPPMPATHSPTPSSSPPCPPETKSATSDAASPTVEVQAENTDPLKGKVNVPWSKASTIPGVGLTDWNAWIFACIHCDHTIEIEQNQINCKIFRDGVWKNNGEVIHSETKEKMIMVQGQFIPPHLSRSWCEELIKQNVIAGCAKPFKFDGVTAPVACEYI